MVEDIQQKFQEIQEQKERLNTAKQNLKTAISGKGVTVPDSAKLDQYYTLVKNIQVGGSALSTAAGVLVEDDGVLKVQKLTFDGTAPSDGDIIEADKFYLFETGKAEPDYGNGGQPTGSSMEIYKCYSVDTENKKWSGYSYNQETKEFADTITEGLDYDIDVPTVGNCYTRDGMIECDISASLCAVYVPLQSKNETAETGQALLYTNGDSGEFQGNFTTYKGVKCLHLNDGMSYIKVTPFAIDESSDWTLSVMLNVDKYSISGSTNYCAISSGENLGDSGMRVHTYKGVNLGIKMYGDNINNPELGVYTDYEADIWTHYTIRNKNGVVEMYKNGVKEPVTSSLVFKFYNGLNIGTRYGESDYFYGYIAELKLYKAAVQTEKIKSEADRCLAMVTE